MMIDLQNIRTQLEPLFIKHGIVRAIVFGSYAKGSATENSDIDMVIDSNGFLRGLNFFTAQYEIAQALPIKSDIFERREIKKGSKMENEILTTGVVIYER
ncbi:MAG: nucleotidyltransferase domain-containing protein [Oscillospiraceae bacterium]|nr:nucleotidyltransferase domain-containing protein [Oscillospiraceae bacterium]